MMPTLTMVGNSVYRVTKDSKNPACINKGTVLSNILNAVSYTHLTLPTTPYV